MTQRSLWLASALMAVLGFGAYAWVSVPSEAAGKPAAAAGTHAVHPENAFGFQYVPKFDEAKGRGAWAGSRARGVAMHEDLGVQVSREGFIWRHYEPEDAGARPNMADFDDVVGRLSKAGIAVEAMVTETPLWASTAPAPDPKNPGSYKFAPPRGLNAPIFADGTDTPGPGKALNPDNTWATSLGHMVARYKGRVRYWQVWNEPDYPSGDQAAGYGDRRRSWNGSVDDYVRLLRVGHTVVKAIDPKAQVVTGGIGFAPYLQAMLDRGAGRYFDQLDFHAYGWPGSDTALAQFRKVHDEMRAVLAKNGLAAKGMICSETGYTALKPDIQAAYIAKLYPTAIAMGVESTMYYANVNPSWKTMGLIDWRTMSQKTAGYWAYKNAAAALRDVKAVAPLRVAGVEGWRFERASGRSLVVAWAPKRAAGEPLAVTLPLGKGRWQLRDAVGRSLGSASGQAKLSLTESPVWLDADDRRAYAPLRPNPALAYPGLAWEKAAADSSFEDQGPPSAAIDLDSDSQWASGEFKQPQAWLSLALRRESTVKELKLKTGPTPAGTWFDVETSTDGRTYKPVLKNVTVASWHLETLAFPAPTKARYIRLTWHNPEKKPVRFGVFEAEAH